MTESVLTGGLGWRDRVNWGLFFPDEVGRVDASISCQNTFIPWGLPVTLCVGIGGGHE